MRITIISLFLLIAPFSADAEHAMIVRSASLWPEPRYAAKPLSTLPPGAEVELLERTGGWQRIKTRSKSSMHGWVRTYQVRSGLESQALKLTPQQETRSGILSGLNAFSRQFSRQDADAVNRSNVVATIGVRGLSEQDLKNAKPNPEELKRMQSYRVSAEQAQIFAKQGELFSQDVALLPGQKETRNRKPEKE